VSEGRAGPKIGDPERALDISGGRQDLAVDGAEVVCADPPFDELSQPFEQLGLMRRREAGIRLAMLPPTDFARNVGALGQELDDLFVKAAEAVAEG